MEYPNEGFYSPDFVESDCSIDLPDDSGLSGEHTPRSRLRTRGGNPWCVASPTAVEMGYSPESFHGSYASYFTASWNSNERSPRNSLYDSDFSVTPRSGVSGSECSAGDIRLSEKASANVTKTIQRVKKPERFPNTNQGTYRCPPIIPRTVPKGKPGDKLNSSNAPSKQRGYPSYAQYYRQEPSPKKKKMNVLGYVPGYGPVHLPEAPVQSKKVPSTGAQLPLIYTKTTKGEHRKETRETKANGLDKNTFDILRSRAKDRLINSHVDERALRKSKRQNPNCR